MPKHVATRQPKTLDRAHDRRQPVNRAASPAWIKGWRDQIQVSKIVGRLQRFGLDDPDAPTGPRMTRTQVQTLLALLRKVLPDMQAIEISGNPDQPIQVQILSFTDAELIEPPKPMITINNIEEHPALIEDEPIELSPRETKGRKRSQ